jgi:hypothetical protein
VIVEIALVVVIGLGAAVVGIRIGMLLAPRVGRRLDREEKPDDRTD